MTILQNILGKSIFEYCIIISPKCSPAVSSCKSQQLLLMSTQQSRSLWATEESADNYKIITLWLYCKTRANTQSAINNKQCSLFKNVMCISIFHLGYPRETFAKAYLIYYTNINWIRNTIATWLGARDTMFWTQNVLSRPHVRSVKQWDRTAHDVWE